MKIYVIFHKNYYNKPLLPIYEPLLVGADLLKKGVVGLCDNMGADNISFKNKNYCELTGVYWIWKHSNEDVVGVCHYRRFFTKNRLFFQKHEFLSEQDIYRILKEYDIILPQKGVGEYNELPAKDFFQMKHGDGIWDLIRESISNLSPDYLYDFDTFSQYTTGYCYNMLIMRKDAFDAYCKWLFEILFDIEKKVTLSEYSEYNQRMMGFISERLINVWVLHHNYRIMEMPVMNTERKNIVIRMLSRVRNIVTKYNV